MQPFAQVSDGEMFLTYAADFADARAMFVDRGLPEDGKIRKQRLRKASKFIYTREGVNVPATVVGEVPVEFQDDEEDPAESTLVDGDVEGVDVLNA